LSSQSAVAVQQPARATWPHVPSGEEQLSVVQRFLSSHLAVSAAALQPVLGVQVSAVQPSLSSHTTAAPPLQLPPAQVSALVHAFESLHVAAFAAFLQPTLATQLSSVQLLPSSQLAAPVPAWQELLLQKSPVVQGLLSLHPTELGAYLQVPPLQLSLVHGLPSLQFLAVPGLQKPNAQLSPTVQALPSSHKLLLLLETQPLNGSQLSVVQGLPSSHLIGAP
jgi:hypothetical protein